jgi:hypothetical protein
MAKEFGTQGVSGGDGGGAGAGRGRRDPVVAVTPEQQRWLEAVVRPVVEEAAARLVSVDANVAADADVAANVDVGEVAQRRRQRRTRWILLGLLVLVGLLGLGVLVGAWFAHGLAVGAAIVP